jgi:hypothetical protein
MSEFARQPAGSFSLLQRLLCVIFAANVLPVTATTFVVVNTSRCVFAISLKALHVFQFLAVTLHV